MERTALAHIAGICGAILLRCGNYPIKDVPQLRSAEAIFEVDLHRSVLKNADVAGVILGSGQSPSVKSGHPLAQNARRQEFV